MEVICPRNRIFAFWGAPKWFVAQKIHQVIEPKPQSGCFHQTHHPFPKSLKNVAKYIESTQGFSSTGNRERSSSSAKLIIAGSCRPLIFLYIVLSCCLSYFNSIPFNLIQRSQIYRYSCQLKSVQFYHQPVFSSFQSKGFTAK
jgi:hypothetical protein